MNTKKKRKIRILTVCAAILIAFVVWVLWANTALVLSVHTVQSERLPASFDGYRIAHVSDLHNAEMGKDNGKLLDMLREAEPDLIVITGDIVDCHRTDIEVALAFAEKAAEIAPCYYVAGNHEERIGEEYDRLRSGLTERNVTVLENEKTELTRGGESIVLMGVDDPGFQVHYLSDDCAAVTENKLQDLAIEENRYHVLLSHRPELFALYAQYGIDLVFTGHAHGGQFRLPLIGGLYAPNQGLFPEYDSGLYTESDTNMLVSRGIGNSLFPLRFHNRPEVILVELKTK